MPPTRRRARAAAGAGAALATAANGPAARSGAGGGNNANESDEDSGPTFNIVEVALKYGEDHENKTKGRANRLLAESKRLATLYTEKVNDVMRAQDDEITALWESYAEATLRDDTERKELNDALIENLLHMEKLRASLGKDTLNLDKGRFTSVSKRLAEDEAKLSASHKRLVKSVRSKKGVYSVRSSRSSAHSLPAGA